MRLRFLALWAINGALDSRRLRMQLDDFKAAGLDGVVFHPRGYPDQPPYLGAAYLARVSDAIVHAQSLGMAFWIYDENGWPSGTVGGKLLRRHPADRQQWAELLPGRQPAALASFQSCGRRWSVVPRLGPGVDYLNPSVARHFLAATHERYRQGLLPAAWDAVESFFCDEPEFGLGHVHPLLGRYGAIPWTPKLPVHFRRRYGLTPDSWLPDLFRRDPAASETRVRFWELLTDLFADGFLAPIDRWCRSHGKRFTAHVKGEEHPLFQVPTSGSCSRSLRCMGLPGIDALERLPHNSFFPRQAASVARQFGSGRCMAEAFGGAGWGAGPGDLERYLLWLGGSGITDIVLHLSQYQLTSAAIRDWPPSQPRHLSWRQAFPEVLLRVRRALAPKRRPADLLVISPHRGIMARYRPWEFVRTNDHDASWYPRTAAGRLNHAFLHQVESLDRRGVPYDVTDERTFEEEGGIRGNKLRLGRAAYDKVVLGEGVMWRAGGRLLARRFPARIGRHSARTRAPVILAAGPKLFMHWTVEMPSANPLALEARSAGRNRYEARFFADPWPDTAEALEARFADVPTHAALNGEPLELYADTDGAYARFPPGGLRPRNLLSFRTPADAPIVSISGPLRVRSEGSFLPGPNGTVRTRGPFRLDSSLEPPSGELVRGGFPFLSRPLLGRAHLPRPMFRLFRLGGIAGDAARVRIGGVDLGWTWGPDWLVEAGKVHRAGALEIELVPSAYNFFGPQRYFLGDGKAISPGQFAGRKNFADPRNAPLRTRTNWWHFKPLRFPAYVQAVRRLSP